MYFGYILTNWPHLTPIWPLMTSERSWYTHFWNQQKKCYPLICISPWFKSVFFKIQISVDIGSFDVDLTPKRSKFDQTKGRNEILTIFSYNIKGQSGDSLWVIFEEIALVMIIGTMSKLVGLLIVTLWSRWWSQKIFVGAI